MLPKSTHFSVSEDIEELQALLQEAGLYHNSIHDLLFKLLLSGSKLTAKQFLSCYIVLPSILYLHTLINRDLSLYGRHIF